MTRRLEEPSHVTSGSPTAAPYIIVGLDRLCTQIREKIARTSLPVLIEGETGVGKEAMAHLVHDASQRCGNPFVVANCGAMPADLVEAELFGHEKGAFTGAHIARTGLFESADGGTLFLDEVGELSRDAQVRFLRVLDRGQIQPVGASTTKRVDVRIVAATNRVLKEEVKAGRFREDLFHRLKVLDITIPPLRERGGLAIMNLADHFLRANSSLGSPDKENFTDEALNAILRNPWPGNVRELENTIRKACVIGESELIGTGELGFIVNPEVDATPDVSQRNIMDSVASLIYMMNGSSDKLLSMMQAAIACVRTNGNYSKAGKMLGISKSTIARRMAELDENKDSYPQYLRDYIEQFSSMLFHENGQAHDDGSSAEFRVVVERA